MSQTIEPGTQQAQGGDSRALKVAFDTAFLTLPPSGIRTYVEGLLGAFAAMDDDVEILTLEPGWMLGRLGAKAMRAGWDTGGVEIARRRHAGNADLLHVPAFSAPLHTAAPLVVTVHDMIPLVLPEYRRSRSMKLYLEVMKRTVRRARMVLTPSRAAARDISTVLGIEEDRIRVIPLAPDPALGPADEMEATRCDLAALNATGPYLFSIAGFDRRKNVPLLVEAFARAIPRLPDDVQLVLAGAPHSENSTVFPPIEPIIAELGVKNRVVLTGRITGEQRRTLYQGALAYVTPSEYEGFGLTALEAMACGVPVIAAARTSHPEVMGDCGILVEPELEELSEAIVRVVSDENVRVDLSRAGLERSRLFSWDRTARATLEAYQEVAAER